MSLVENLVNQISTKGLGGITKPQGFDLNDSTFENLLQKAITNQSEISNTLQILGNFGQPSGMIIEPFDKTAAVEPIGQENTISNEPVQIKEVDLGNDYFAELLKKSPKEHMDIMNVAKKYAATAYNTFGKPLIENLGDLAKDVTSMI